MATLNVESPDSLYRKLQRGRSTTARSRSKSPSC